MPRRPPKDPFEALWRHRETAVYPSLFGPAGKGIYALTADAYLRLGARAIDPRWLTYGIHRHRPTASRPTTLHVSHGLSLPWEAEPADWDPDAPSGLGYEIAFETPKAWGWALELAAGVLAYATLIASDFAPRQAPDPVLRPGARVAWGVPVDGRPRCRFRTLLVLSPPVIPSGFATDAGRVEILQVTCVTDREAAFARRHGSERLAARLAAAGHVAFDPGRPELPDIEG